MILSRNRAISTYNYLKSILGDDLETPDLAPAPDEKEEIQSAKNAQAKSQEYSIFDPSTRSVKIVAHGEPPKDGSEADDEYDSKLRRVDVKIDGALYLNLQRSQ